MNVIRNLGPTRRVKTPSIYAVTQATARAVMLVGLGLIAGRFIQPVGDAFGEVTDCEHIESTSGDGISPATKDGSGRAHHLICSDPELRSLEKLLDRVFTDVERDAEHASTGKTEQKLIVGREQQDWITAVRNACMDVACLKEAYLERLGSLDSFARSPESSVASTGFSGTWTRTDPTGFESGVLVVRSDSAKGFSFEVSATNGARSAEFSGDARKSGRDVATYDGDKKCSLSFSISRTTVGNRLIVTENGCVDFAGVGVSLAGTYAPMLDSVESEPSPDRLFLKDSELNSKFRALVGESYTAFLDTAHVARDEEDLDGFGARVQSFFVRGLSTVAESIVIVGPKQELWAAVIGPIDGSSNSPRIRYYSNQPEWMFSLPKTVQEWMSPFSEYPVDYLSVAAHPVVAHPTPRIVASQE